MQIKLSDHFTYGRLLRYTLPTIVMIIFTSLYSVVDGLFVSNLVGDLALSAVNIAFPITMIIGAFGFMLGTAAAPSWPARWGREAGAGLPVFHALHLVRGGAGRGALHCDHRLHRTHHAFCRG